jgi:dienelactone hydrolase
MLHIGITFTTLKGAEMEEKERGTATTIEVLRKSELADDPITLQLSGFEPGQSVTIKAEMKDDDGMIWSSRTIFEANEEGEVDLSKQSPISGSYTKADPSGFLWSMSPQSDAKILSNYKKDTVDPDSITVSAEVDGDTVASQEFERLYLLSGVEKEAVKEEGLVGMFIKPAASEPRPGILVLGGSDGRMRKDFAAILASRGYPALALGYFSLEGLPQELIEIPLEYFEKAIGWMEAREEVSSGHLGVVGKSKGGELALLVGATFKEIKAVVSYVGSGVVFQGIHEDPRNHKVQSSWSWQGEPVPFLPFKQSLSALFKIIWVKSFKRPFITRPLYESALKEKDAVEKAIIKVENTNGPLLLISGEHDQIWPSSPLSQMAIDRLASHNHPHPYRHLSYKDAGHGMGLPYRPTMVNQLYEPPSMILPFGGSPEENARACEDAWNHVLEFFEESFKAK